MFVKSKRESACDAECTVGGVGHRAIGADLFGALGCVNCGEGGYGANDGFACVTPVHAYPYVSVATFRACLGARGVVVGRGVFLWD